MLCWKDRERYDSHDDTDYRDGKSSLKSSLRATSIRRAIRDESPPRVGDFQEGMKVEARYQGHGAWYAAKIKRINADRTIDVIYKDGEAATGLHHSTIRQMREGSIFYPLILYFPTFSLNLS